MAQESGFPAPTYSLQTPLDLSAIVTNESWTNFTNIAQENQWYLEFPIKRIFNGFPGVNNIYFNIQDFEIPGFAIQSVNKNYRGIDIPLSAGVRKEGNDNMVEINYLVDANFTQYKLIRLWFYLTEYAMKKETINTQSLEIADATSLQAYCGMVPAMDISLYYVDSKKRIAMITQFLNCFPVEFGKLDMKTVDPKNIKHSFKLKYFLHRDFM
jgi:hypothetical protein